MGGVIADLQRVANEDVDALMTHTEKHLAAMLDASDPRRAGAAFGEMINENFRIRIALTGRNSVSCELSGMKDAISPDFVRWVAARFFEHIAIPAGFTEQDFEAFTDGALSSVANWE